MKKYLKLNEIGINPGDVLTSSFNGDVYLIYEKRKIYIGHKYPTLFFIQTHSRMGNKYQVKYGSWYELDLKRLIQKGSILIKEQND